jgi:CRP/FNR family transcriptional regulator
VKDMLLNELVMKYGDKVSYKKNQELNIKMNHGLFYINRGTVKLLFGHTKKQTIALDIYKRGEFFGYIDRLCFTGECHTKTVFLEDAELLFLDNETIHNHSIMDNSLRVHFLKVFGTLLKDSIQRLFILSALKKSEIIMHMLYYLALKFGRVLESGRIMVTIKLNNTDFREICNTTRENVSRTLSNLKRDGILDVQNGHLIFSSKDVLDDLMLDNYFA